MDLSLVVPAYNEAAAVRAGRLEVVREWMAGYAGDSELIVVDDGSTDNTREKIEILRDSRLHRDPSQSPCSSLAPRRLCRLRTDR